MSKDIPISPMGKVYDEKYFVVEKFINELQKMSVDLKNYNNMLDCDLEKLLMPSIDKFVQNDLCIYENGMLSTTQKGVFWGNNIIDEFVEKIVG